MRRPLRAHAGRWEQYLPGKIRQSGLYRLGTDSFSEFLPALDPLNGWRDDAVPHSFVAAGLINHLVALPTPLAGFFEARLSPVCARVEGSLLHVLPSRA